MGSFLPNQARSRARSKSIASSCLAVAGELVGRIARTVCIRTKADPRAGGSRRGPGRAEATTMNEWSFDVIWENIYL
jgi:hypothetical protein